MIVETAIHDGRITNVALCVVVFFVLLKDREYSSGDMSISGPISQAVFLTEIFFSGWWWTSSGWGGEGKGRGDA